MVSDLAAYWGQFQFEPGKLQIHPDDEEWFRSNSPSVLSQDVIRNFNEYIGSSRFGDRFGLHLSLIPVPFVGNLASAEVIIFLQNPGLAPADYYLDPHPEFRETALRNLRQEPSDEYPFWSLNPAFAWSEAFRWWERKFSPVITALQDDGMTYIDALHFISNRVATVELFPYHSVDGSTLARLGKWQQMPSTVRAQQFFCEIASNPNVLKLVVRSHAHWTNGTEYPDTHHFHQAPRSRGFTFNSKAGEKSGIAGERLLARLKLSRRS